MPTAAYLMTAFAVLLVCGTHYYIARHLCAWLRQFLPGVPAFFTAVLWAVLTAVMVLGFLRSMLPVSDGIKRFLRVAGSYWMGIFVYLLLFFLLADLAVLLLNLVHPLPRNARFLAASAALLLTLCTVTYGFLHARGFVHVSYDIPLEQGPEDGLRLVLVSDLHLGAVGSEERLESLVEEINGLSPDVICIAGDLFDNDFDAIAHPEAAKARLSRLSAPYGVYACWGNHDAGATLPRMEAFLRACGITLLQEEVTAVGGKIQLAGRADGFPIGGADRPRGDWAQVAAQAREDLPLVVLDHNPANIREYGAETALVLSGHTHKGQIFPAGLVTKQLFTVDHGLYRRDETGTQVVVTSGAGTWGMPMRVGSDCEIVTLNLFRK
ncbi:MAG: metallophosphoesterase [Clostridia bacterium]|nr:metallophosphoesterase [Clostridia bacterium]